MSGNDATIWAAVIAAISLVVGSILTAIFSLIKDKSNRDTLLSTEEKRFQGQITTLEVEHKHHLLEKKHQDRKGMYGNILAFCRELRKEVLKVAEKKLSPENFRRSDEWISYNENWSLIELYGSNPTNYAYTRYLEAYDKTDIPPEEKLEKVIRLYNMLVENMKRDLWGESDS